MIKESSNTQTNNSEICSYYNYFNITCSFSELNSSESYHKIKTELVKTFPSDGKSVVIQIDKDSSYQVTSTRNELDSLNAKDGLSVIELLDCERILKEKNNIEENVPLIIFKYEKSNGPTNNKNIQYEIYNPNTFEKLDLSVCDNNINVYIPVTLNEKSQELYNEVNKQEYDLLDINGNFYNDICTPFSSDKDTDVILNDRIKYYYNMISNDANCPQNCDLINYISETNKVKCVCQINNDSINTEKSVIINNITTNINANDYKYSSYKTMKCSNLVFDSKTFGKNAGGILMIFSFAGFLCTAGFFSLKTISPLKVSISKILSKTQNNNDFKIFEYQTKPTKKNDNENNKIESIKKDENILDKKDNPPRKVQISNKRNTKSISPDPVNIIKEKNQDIEVNSIKSGKDADPIKENLETVNIIDTKSIIKLEENSKIKNNEEKVEKISINEKPKLDDYEIYHLEFSEAITIDKRDYLTIYLSLLKREQLIMFTFLSWNDYNLFYVKIARFLVMLSTEIAMNALFFADKTLNKLFLDEGKYNFGQSIPQIIYSILVTHALEVLLCYLTMTDRHLYEIKSLKNNKSNSEKASQLLKYIQIKLIIFFGFTGALFIFYWYCIAAFCAVYQKSQGFLILNAFLSFLFEMIDAFIIYGIITLLRVMALKYSYKKMSIWLYKISKFFPIF